MTEQVATLQKSLVKGTNASVLRGTIGLAAERLTELEVGGLTGVAGMRQPQRPLL